MLRVGLDDVATGSLNVDDGARDQIPPFGTKEEALSHTREAIVGRYATRVVKAQPPCDFSADGEVTLDPAAGATVTNRHTAISTHVIFRVSSDKDFMNATFSSEITHGQVLL
ncbi:MAG: hypothetical protein ACI9KE_002218 [Polyangiales bacterium]